jgi:hypothetical protein
LIPPASPEAVAQAHVEPEGDDGWLQDWEKELLAENEVIAQLQAASLGGNGERSASDGAAPQKSAPATGKKKKKKITLMSTTARRAA